MPSRFQPTRWSLIQETSATEEPLRNRAWGEFDHLYREPLLRFIRRSGWPPDRAEDLLQSFLALVAERSWLAEADPERGKMRTFLLTRLKRHLTDARKHDLAAKRGGKAVVISLQGDSDLGADEITAPAQPGTGLHAERQFDREWAHAVLAHTLAELEAQADAAGKGEIFRILKSQITGGCDEKLRDAAERLGQTEGSVRMKLQRLREEFRTRLRAEVAETLLPGEDISEEMRYLASVLSD